MEKIIWTLHCENNLYFIRNAINIKRHVKIQLHYAVQVNIQQFKSVKQDKYTARTLHCMMAFSFHF